MMLWLTEDATLVCAHELGQVQNVPTQNVVTIENRRVLVATDPEGKAIKGCPNVGAAIKPCLTTLKVAVGYSPFLTVEDHRICLDSVTGFTDGTPPMTVKYKVRHAGQPFVGEQG
jgi:hypothetical protein